MQSVILPYARVISKSKNNLLSIEFRIRSTVVLPTCFLFYPSAMVSQNKNANPTNTSSRDAKGDITGRMNVTEGGAGY
jgi:hypothetical protein